MAIIKPDLSGNGVLKYSGEDNTTTLNLSRNYKYLYAKEVKIDPQETIYIDFYGEDFVLFLWDGDTLIGSSRNKLQYKNSTNGRKNFQLVIKKFDQNDENGTDIPSGTYTAWNSKNNFSDGRTDGGEIIGSNPNLIVEYTFSKPGTYFIRENEILKRDGQSSIPPKYSLDGVNFLDLIPNENGELEIQIDGSETLTIVSNKDSLWRVTGEQTLPYGNNNPTSSISSSSLFLQHFRQRLQPLLSLQQQSRIP